MKGRQCDLFERRFGRRKFAQQKERAVVANSMIEMNFFIALLGFKNEIMEAKIGLFDSQNKLFFQLPTVNQK